MALVTFLAAAVLLLFLVGSARSQGWTYRFGTRTVLDQYGSLQGTRGIARTQLVLANNTFFWNSTDYVDGKCTEVSFHVIRPSPDGAYVWTGTVSTPGSFRSTVNATLHQYSSAGFYGSGTFTTPTGFVVPFSFIWLQGLGDYQALTFTDTETGMVSGITLEETMETDYDTWKFITAGVGTCDFKHMEDFTL